METIFKIFLAVVVTMFAFGLFSGVDDKRKYTAIQKNSVAKDVAKPMPNSGKIAK